MSKSVNKIKLEFPSARSYIPIIGLLDVGPKLVRASMSGGFQ